MEVEIKTRPILMEKHESRMIEQKGLLGYAKMIEDFYERALKK
jgi:hypothetical protein